MADRQFTCPIPRTAQMPAKMIPPTIRLERVALKWRALAERRRDHFIDLYQSGRWRHYYSDQEFLEAMHDALALAERWALIAPRPSELDPVGPPPPARRLHETPPGKIPSGGPFVPADLQSAA
jgi:hypothetical protein